MVDFLEKIGYNETTDKNPPNADGLKRESEKIMKNTKRVAILMSLVMLLSTLMLTACNININGFLENTDEHTHNWSNWVTLKRVTKMQDGLLERSCSSCGEKQTFVLKSSDVYQDGVYNIVGNIPDNWSPINCTEEDGKQILKYLSTPLFVYEYKKYAENKGYTVDGFIDESQLVFSEEYPYYSSDYFIDYLAAVHLQDVTSQLVGYPKWGYTEGQMGYAWKITIRDDMKWENGTPIRAYDFIYSMRQVLDPRFQSPNAAFYYDTLGIKNARAYCTQDPKLFHESSMGLGPKPSVTWEDVGIFVYSEYEFVLCLDKSFQFLDDGGSLAPAVVEYLTYLPLVHEGFYEATRTELEETWIFASTYNTSVVTTISYGPYKLVEYKAGNYYKLEINENWFGWYISEDYINRYSVNTINCFQTQDSMKE